MNLFYLFSLLLLFLSCDARAILNRNVSLTREREDSKSHLPAILPRAARSCPDIQLPAARTVGTDWEYYSQDPSTGQSSSNDVELEAVYQTYLTKGKALWADFEKIAGNPRYKDKPCMADFNKKFQLSSRGIRSPSKGLTPIFKRLGLPTDKIYTSVDVSTPIGVDPPDGSWINAYSPKAGAIIAVLNDRGKTNERWSDITWTIWKRICRDQNTYPSNLKHIFQNNVKNEKTLDLIEYIKRTQGTDFTEEQSYTPCDDEFYAFMYSPSGNGIIRMLMDHYHDMEWQTLASISIEKTAGDDYMLWGEYD